MCLFHEVLGINENILDMNELTRHGTGARLSPQREPNDSTIVVLGLEQRHVEDLLERLELVLELLDVLSVVLEVEDGHVGAFVRREPLVRVDERHFVARQNGYEVRDVEERDELGGLLSGAHAR